MGPFNSNLLSNLCWKCGQRWNYLFLLSSMVISWKCFMHANLQVPLTVEQPVELVNTRVTGELRFLWFIHFNRPTCMWHSTEIFSWVQPPYAPKPIYTNCNQHTEARTMMADVLHAFPVHFWLKINLNLSWFPSVRLAHWLIYYGLTPIWRNRIDFVGSKHSNVA